MDNQIDKVDVQALVRQLLAEGGDVEATLIRVSAAMHDTMGWDEVTFWPSDGRLGPPQSVRGVDATARAVAVSTSYSRRADAPLSARLALVSHVLATGKPTALTDVADGSAFSTVALAAAEPGRSAFAFPVWGTTKLLGVMECLTAAPRSLDATYLREAAVLGAAIGEFIERQREREASSPLPRYAAQKMTPTTNMDRLRHLDAAFSALTDSVLIFDREGQILCANAADRTMLGYDARSDARSKSFTTSLRERGRLVMARDEHGQPITDDQSPFARILRGETLSGQQAMEASLRTADGRDIEVSISGEPLVDARGILIGGVAVMRDVTEQHLYERGLQETALSMREFLAIAAHELRTPISASKGYIQLATRRLTKLAGTATSDPLAWVDGVEPLRTNLEDAERSTRRLGRLVDRLLDIANIQANKLEMRPEAVDLAAIVRATVREQRLATPARALRFKVRPIRAVPTWADPDRIGQVLLNYLANALKYSPEDSVVEVTLDVRDREARVSVRDRGPGISLDDQKRIWYRFEQLKLGGTATGLGLGLYISRAIVEAHGGHVGVESEVGRGSVFWFEVPLVRSAESILVAQTSERLSTLPSTRSRDGDPVATTL